MFAKTFCSPGSYVEVVPVGLLLTIQYNKDGLVEKIRKGFDDSGEELTPAEVRAIVNYLPNTIRLTGGTTYVYGVLYDEDIPSVEGLFPSALDNIYLDRALDGKPMKFFAGNISSLAANFQGAVPIRNWLNSSKFNVLPGIVVPLKLTEDTIKMMMTTNNFNFQYPYIAGIIEFAGTESSYTSLDLISYHVVSIENKLSENGYVLSDITTDLSKFTIPYNEVVKWNIQKNAYILTHKFEDEPVEVLASKLNNKPLPIVSAITATCPVCKKNYIVSAESPAQCDDTSCLSRLYPQAVKMLNILELPTLTFDRYKEAIKNDEILAFTDILLLPEFESFKPISTSLSNVIRCATPVEVCADDTFFDKLAASCNNSTETLMYYVQNPIRMVTDLDITNPIGQKFVQWISLPANVLMLQTLLAEINVVARRQKFEGAPIFRNKRILLTGKFLRGSYDEVASILESYAATIQPSIDGLLPDCVIVGGTHDGIDGAVIQKAKLHNLPVFDEDAFFTKYEIDQDLAANLL